MWPRRRPLQVTVSGIIVDVRNEPVGDAQILDPDGKLLATSAADGTFTVPASTGRVQIVAAHFEPCSLSLTGPSPVHVLLEHPLESVVVTAYRSPLASGDSPASTRILTQEHLQRAAGISLDDKLRQVPGFELFRRTSSLVANPTTEGISLRGLGSTAASRSLVVFDDIPIADPYGGWIHWEELPPPVIQAIELVRGGASDLYGSSAIGGVINVIPIRPRENRFVLSTSGGSEATSNSTLLGTLKLGRWSALSSGQVVATDGYTLVAPNLRGPIDQPSNVHGQNGLVEFDRELPDSGRLFLRGSTLNEDRHNGTPIQINSTRLWRYAGGADWRGWKCGCLEIQSTIRKRFEHREFASNRDADAAGEEPGGGTGRCWSLEPTDRHPFDPAGAGGDIMMCGPPTMRPCLPAREAT